MLKEIHLGLHTLGSRIVGVVGALVCAAVLAGTMAPQAGQSSQSPRGWPDKIVLGLVPSEASADIVSRYKPMTEHLEKCLGIRVEPMSASDYSGVITAMTHKHVDVAYLGPKSYVEAASRAGAQAVAMELSTDGQAGYHGVIIARKEKGYSTIQDVRGKTFAFTDPNSTSGYLVPLTLFKRDLKEEPSAFFKDVRFAGSQAAAILAVKNGSVDAAATNDLDMARVVKSGVAKAEEFNVIWTSELIPGSPMVVRKDLPESLKHAIIGAFMTLGDDKPALERLGNGGYIYANDGAFDVIRYLIRLQEETTKK
jgi:phosphonate transport system substrate-binding protein